jgi:hypothetical protein
MSNLRDVLNKNTNEMEKLDSITILLTNVVEFLSTFAEDLSDKVDMLEMKIDKVDERVQNIHFPEHYVAPIPSPIGLPPPPPLVKPAVPKIENLRGKIMDELKEQLKRIKERSEEEE